MARRAIKKELGLQVVILTPGQSDYQRILLPKPRLRCVCLLTGGPTSGKTVSSGLGCWFSHPQLCENMQIL